MFKIRRQRVNHIYILYSIGIREKLHEIKVLKEKIVKILHRKLDLHYI